MRSTAPYTQEALRIVAAADAATTIDKLDALLRDAVIFNRLLDSGEVSFLRLHIHGRIGDLKRAERIAAGDPKAKALQHALDRVDELEARRSVKRRAA